MSDEKIGDRLAIWLVPRLIKLTILFLSGTIRWRMVGVPYSSDDPQRKLYAFWHARLLMQPWYFRGWYGYVLISSHRDGGFIADTMHLLDIETIRGSSTRGGARAMLQMLRAVKRENRHLAITPDGPKGPREQVGEGTVQLAIKAGIPVVPICYATRHHWRLNSWDRFYLPRPFTSGVFVIGDPVFLSADEEPGEALRRVQQAMDDNQRQADSYFN